MRITSLIIIYYLLPQISFMIKTVEQKELMVNKLEQRQCVIFSSSSVIHRPFPRCLQLCQEERKKKEKKNGFPGKIVGLWRSTLGVVSYCIIIMIN